MVRVVKLDYLTAQDVFDLEISMPPRKLRKSENASAISRRSPNPSTIAFRASRQDEDTETNKTHRHDHRRPIFEFRYNVAKNNYSLGRCETNIKDISHLLLDPDDELARKKESALNLMEADLNYISHLKESATEGKTKTIKDGGDLAEIDWGEGIATKKLSSKANNYVS